MLYYLEGYEIYSDLVYLGKFVLGIISEPIGNDVNIIHSNIGDDNELGVEVGWDLSLPRAIIALYPIT